MKRTASAVWSGALRDGKGSISTQSGVLKDSPYTFKARFEDESGKSATNPEELIAAAHASCFTMQLSHFLAEAGHPAKKLTTEAVVTIEPVEGKGNTITRSTLTLRGDVPGMDAAKFTELANKAKAGCPVSRALGAIEVTLDAKLEG
jgi:osmotically inducible protein OsmC